MLSEIIDFCLEHANEIKDYEIENYFTTWGNGVLKEVTFYLEDGNTKVFGID